MDGPAGATTREDRQGGAGVAHFTPGLDEKTRAGEVGHPFGQHRCLGEPATASRTDRPVMPRQSAAASTAVTIEALINPPPPRIRPNSRFWRGSNASLISYGA